MITLLLAAAIFGALLISKTIFGSYLAPFGVFTNAWGATLLIVSILTLPQFPFHIHTWLAIMLSWGVFFLGTITALFIVLSAFQTISCTQKKTTLSPQFKKIVYLFNLLSIIGAIRFATIVLIKVGYTTFMDNPLVTRELLLTAGAGKLTLLFEAFTYAAAALSGIWIGSRHRSFIPYLSLLAATIHGIFFVGRSHTIIAIIIFIFSFLLTKQRSRKTKQAQWLVFIFVVLLASTVILRTGKYRSPIEIDTWVPQDVLRGVEIMHNWYLLDAVMRDPPELAWGVNSFFSIVRLLDLMNLWDGDPRKQALAQNVHSTNFGIGVSNKYTIIGDIYADFGILGLLVFFYILGFASSYVFLLYQRKRHLWHIAFLTFVYTEIAFSVSGNTLSGYAFGFGMIVTIIAAGMSDKKTPKALPQPSYEHSQTLL